MESNSQGTKKKGIGGSTKTKYYDLKFERERYGFDSERNG